MSEEISQQEIDEFITDLAKNHPEFTIDQFKKDFKAAISRDPKFSEIRTFQKSGNVPTLSGKASTPSGKTSTTKVIAGYTFCEILGKGSFGEVYKCQKDGKDYAVKCIDESKMSAEVEQAFADSISPRLNSKFLVKYFDRFRGPSGELYVVMELCPKGDLRSLIDTLRRMDANLKPTRVKKIFVQLLLGLEVMHRFKLIHRDLKPDNIFSDKEDNIKIGDFGCTKELDTTSQKAHTIIGTPLYESPQIIKGEEYDSSADMWALGVMMYELCMLKRPFDTTNRYKLQEMILAGKYEPLTEAHCPKDLACAIHSLLSVEPAKRPSAHYLLSSPLIQTYAKEAGLSDYIPSDAAVPVTTTTPRTAAAAGIATTNIATVNTKPTILTPTPTPAVTPKVSSLKPLPLTSRPHGVTLPNLPICFIADKYSRHAFVVTGGGDGRGEGGGGTCRWTKDAGDWAILDQEMVAGIYAMEVEFTIPEVKWIEIGLISKAALTADRSQYMCRVAGACCLAYSKYFDDGTETKAVIFTGNFVRHGENDLFPSEFNGKIRIKLELNLDSHSLYFFINGKESPHCVKQIPSSVYFTIGGIGVNTQFTVTFFQKLTAPTANTALEYDSYDWS